MSGKFKAALVENWRRQPYNQLVDNEEKACVFWTFQSPDVCNLKLQEMQAAEQWLQKFVSYRKFISEWQTLHSEDKELN